MSCPSRFAFVLAIAAALAEPACAQDFGRPARPDEINLWNIDVRPDGAGLPKGHGTVAQGRSLFEDNCLACHGEKGVGGIADRLSGGRGTLTSDHPLKTIGSFWPYATTLFDYVRRAMPYTAPGTLSDDDTYSLVAYLLSLNGVVPANATLDRASLLAIKMPNRDGFVPDEAFVNSRNYRQP